MPDYLIQPPFSRCSVLTNLSPWLQLYDGSFIRTNEVLANCRYFCSPYAITGKN